MFGNAHLQTNCLVEGVIEAEIMHVHKVREVFFVLLVELEWLFESFDVVVFELRKYL